MIDVYDRESSFKYIWEKILTKGFTEVSRTEAAINFSAKFDTKLRLILHIPKQNYEIAQDEEDSAELLFTLIKNSDFEMIYGYFNIFDIIEKWNKIWKAKSSIWDIPKNIYLKDYLFEI